MAKKKTSKRRVKKRHKHVGIRTLKELNQRLALRKQRKSKRK